MHLRRFTALPPSFVQSPFFMAAEYQEVGVGAGRRGGAITGLFTGLKVYKGKRTLNYTGRGGRIGGVTSVAPPPPPSVLHSWILEAPQPEGQ